MCVSKRDAIQAAIVEAERKASDLRAAVRVLKRIAHKINRTESDGAAHAAMCARLERYGLAIPDEWRTLAW